MPGDSSGLHCGAMPLTRCNARSHNRTDTLVLKWPTIRHLPTTSQAMAFPHQQLRASPLSQLLGRVLAPAFLAFFHCLARLYTRLQLMKDQDAAAFKRRQHIHQANHCSPWKRWRG